MGLEVRSAKGLSLVCTSSFCSALPEEHQPRVIVHCPKAIRLLEPLWSAPHRRQGEPGSTRAQPYAAGAHHCLQLRRPSPPSTQQDIFGLLGLGSDKQDVGRSSRYTLQRWSGYQTRLETRQERGSSPLLSLTPESRPPVPSREGRGFKIRLLLFFILAQRHA